MKKRIAAVLLLLCMLTVPAFAAEGEEELYQDQMEATGTDQLFGQLPEETQELLDDLGIDAVDFSLLSDISPRSILDLLIRILSGQAESPLKAVLRVLGVLLLLAMLESLRDKRSLGNESGGVASTLFVVLILAQPIALCLVHARSAIQLGANFMLVFVPVLTAIIAAGGSPTAAAGYYALVIGAAEGIAQLSKLFLAPCIGIFLAFHVVCSFSHVFDFSKLSDFIKKALTTILGFGMTLFVGLLTTRGALAKAADTVAMKGGKFLLGSLVPVVGGALSDALGAIMSSLSLVRSTAGIFGILALVLIFLPILIELLLWQLCLHATAACADALGQKNMGNLLKGIAGALTLLHIILLCTAVLLLISTAVMLMIKADV